MARDLQQHLDASHMKDFPSFVGKKGHKCTQKPTKPYKLLEQESSATNKLLLLY